MKFILFHAPDKKVKLLLIYSFACAACFIICKLMKGIAPFEFDFFDSICQLIIFIPLYLYETFKNKDNLKDLSTSSNIYEFSNCKDYIIFIMIIILNFIMNIIHLNSDKSLKNMLKFVNTYNLEILFGKIMVNIYTNGKYYLHQFIHHIMISLLAIGIDCIVYYYNRIIFDAPHMILYFLYAIIYCIIISYKKYLIEIKNFSVYKLCSVFGICNIIFYIIVIIIKYSNDKFMCFNGTCLFYFEHKINSAKIFFSLILCTINIYLFYSIIYHFESYLVFVVFIQICFCGLGLNLISNKNVFHIILGVILTILIMISFLVFLEVIEINICGLNLNVRRNIIQREEDEKIFIEDEKRENDKEKNNLSFEMAGGYIVNMWDDDNINDDISK